MNIPCPDKLNCVCADSPFANLSSEAPDKPTFVAMGYFAFIPPLGSDWTASNCVTTCDSDVSQEAADRCAAFLAQLCVYGGVPTDGTSPEQPPVPPAQRPGGNRNLPTVFNTSQDATVNCPDGLPFTYMVPAGQYAALAFGFTAAALSAAQLDANMQAQTAALQLALAHQICLSDIVTPACANLSYESTILATGGFLSSGTQSDLWELQGTLPDGLDMETGNLEGHQTALRGTPTTPGVYSFSVKVTDPVGDTMVKPYTLMIAGITNANSLPDPLTTQPYSQQLSSIGFVNPVFSVASGSLPDGLTLSLSGLISGTPTTAGVSNFVVRVTDDQGLNCTQAISLTVDPGACVLPNPLPDAQFQTSYQVILTAPSMVNPVFSLDSGVLPDGLFLINIAGTEYILGTPTTDGQTTSFVIKVVGDNGQCSSSLTLHVGPRPLFPWNLTWAPPTISGVPPGTESHTFNPSDFTTDATNGGVMCESSFCTGGLGGHMSYTGGGGTAELALTINNNGNSWGIQVWQDANNLLAIDNTTNPGTGTFTFYIPINSGVGSNIRIFMHNNSDPAGHINLVGLLS